MNVLALVAYPDDETLGAGGTLLKHAARGDSLAGLVATSPHEPQWSRETIERKTGEIEVAAAYGMAATFRLGLPAARLDTVPQVDLIEALRDVVTEVRPPAAMSVLKPFHMLALGTRRVLAMETLSSTDAAPPQAARFVPTVVSDVTAHLDRKLEIMALYESEAQPDPRPRGASAIRALARLRGASFGVEYAEAFMLVRELDA